MWLWGGAGTAGQRSWQSKTETGTALLQWVISGSPGSVGSAPSWLQGPAKAGRQATRTRCRLNGSALANKWLCWRGERSAEWLSQLCSALYPALLIYTGTQPGKARQGKHNRIPNIDRHWIMGIALVLNGHSTENHKKSSWSLVTSLWLLQW